ncbi:MAG: oligosaccharide flippase family protein [Microgenomates group bacterium]
MTELNLDNLKSRAFKGVFTLTFRRLILKIIDTVGLIFLARALTTDSFGVFGIISFVVFTFLSFFSDIGFGAALIQKKEELSVEDTRTTFTIQQVLVSFLLLICWLVSPAIAGGYNLGNQGMWLIRVLSISLFITSFKTIPSILLERELKFEKLIIPEILETLTYNGIAVYMALHDWGVWSLVIAILARTVIGAIALNLIKPWQMGWTFSKRSASALLHFGVPYQLNSVLALIKDNVAPTLIAFWYGPAAVAYVNLAQNIASRPMEIINIVSRVTFPAYSRIQGDLPRVKRWIEKSVSFMAYLYYPAITGLIIVAPGILQYLYANKADKWLPALPTLLLFLAGAFPIIITTTYTNALYALGRPKVVLSLMGIYTVLTWALGAPLIYKYGYVGIAMAGLIITYVTLPIVVGALNNLVKVDTWDSVKKPLLASLIMGAVTYYINLIFTHSLLTLAFTCLVGMVTYILAIIIIDGHRLKSELATYGGLIGKRNT